MTQPRSDRPASGRFSGDTAARPQRFASSTVDLHTGSLPVIGRVPRLATPSPAPKTSAPNEQQSPVASAPRLTLKELSERASRPQVSLPERPVHRETVQPGLGEKLTALAQSRHQALKRWTSTAVIVLLMVVSGYSLIALRQTRKQAAESQSITAEAPPLWKTTPIVITSEPSDDEELVAEPQDEPEINRPLLAQAESVSSDDDEAIEEETIQAKKSATKATKPLDAPKVRAIGVTSLTKSKPPAARIKPPSDTSPYPETSYPLVDLSRIERRGSHNEPTALPPPAVAELPGRIEPYVR